MSSPASVGPDSCIGQDACTGATGRIGANSCNGDRACYEARGDIADRSCNGPYACDEARHIVVRHDSCTGDHACWLAATATIERHSCNGDWACDNSGGKGSDEPGKIGRYSCNGDEACSGSLGFTGRHACNGYRACWSAESEDIGAGSCNADHACEGYGWPKDGGAYYITPIGAGSCNGFATCFMAEGPVGKDSCNGSESCELADGGVGDDSCNGNRACYKVPEDVGDCANNLPDSVPRVCLTSGYLPDGRIRKGSGAFVGNDIYNTTGADQVKSIVASQRAIITFGISVQNDSAVNADSFTLTASGSTSDMYKVTYFKGPTNITAAVVAGTYATPTLAPGAKYLITAKVKVKAAASAGSSVSRLVTITSAGDGSRQDAVMFTVGVAAP